MPHPRHNLADKPYDGVYVRSIIHRADKSDCRGPAERVCNPVRRVEIDGIDAIIDVVGPRRGLRSKAPEQIGLGAGDEEDTVGRPGGATLESEQRSRLTRVDEARQPGCGLGIVAPLFRIDIDMSITRRAARCRAM